MLFFVGLVLLSIVGLCFALSPSPLFLFLPLLPLTLTLTLTFTLTLSPFLYSLLRPDIVEMTK